MYRCHGNHNQTYQPQAHIWRSVTDKVQNEQYETHTNKTKIGHKISKQQKMNRTTQK